MTLHHLLLILHLLSAAIWVGGHLLLAISYLPHAARDNNAQTILAFEGRYEQLGMSSLLVLVTTGIAMSVNYGVYPSQWFAFESAIEKVVSVKLLLLFFTIVLALSARFWAIPRLKSGESGIITMAVHIVLVTLAGVAMLIFGSFIRFGGL